MSDPVSVRKYKGVLILTMARRANALDPELMSALVSEVEKAKASGSPPLVLASSHPRLFCPGWDLKRLADADRDEVAAFLRDFDRLILTLFSYPGPTVAEVGGHAIAGGCALAIACDKRFMLKGPARIGFSEVNIGVPVPAACVEMLLARVGPSVAQRLVLEGDGFSAQRAYEEGLIHGIAESKDELRSLAVTEAAVLGTKPRAAYAAAKKFLFRRVWERMKHDPDDEKAFLDSWFSEETQDRIAGIVRRLTKQ